MTAAGGPPGPPGGPALSGGGGPVAVRRVRPLREQVARRIAAGEVIERPAAVVRELLDNALDAGATEIVLRLDNGGLSRIEVSDDGSGIGPSDLEACAFPHSTSKISEEEDLARITSLGFRGEALASIAVCARLELTSRSADEASAWRLVVDAGVRRAVEPCPGRRGTLVSVTDLFAMMPARRRFLKSASAESALCRTVLEERALAFPSVAFRLFVSGDLKAFYPAATPLERARAVLARSVDEPSFLEETVAAGESFSLRLVLGRPELARGDRRLMQVYVNRRRIQEYSLVQAVDYGYTGYVPGGLHPVALVFADVAPELVDFNVHPAKREARIRILPDLHRAVVAATSGFLPRHAIRPAAGPAPVEPRQQAIAFPREAPPAAGRARLLEEVLAAAQAGRVAGAAAPGPQPPQPSRLRVLGQVFGLFLLVESGETLYIIDQHAAHERILMDEMLARPKQRQELLLPISFDATAEQIDVLEQRAALLQRLGIDLERTGQGSYEITALPPEFEAIAAGELVRVLKEFDRSPEVLEREIHALAACHTALRDGDPVDPVTAAELARAALALPDARCPHGRPLWVALSRAELMRLVGRLT
jgi:DNA mismatch repair protein MutL